MPRKRRKARSAVENTPKPLFITIGILLVFGIMMIYDATAVQSQGIYGNAYKFVSLHLGWVVVGLFGFLFFYKLDYTKLDKIAYIFFLMTLVFLAALALFGLIPCDSSVPFAPCINGANRWFYINPPPLPELPLVGILGFQPAELAKLSLILYLSVQICKNIKKNEDPFVVYLFTTGLIAFLILLQPNLSTAVLTFVLGSIMYFVSGAPLKPFLILAPVFLVFVSIAIIASPYRRARLTTYLTGETSEEVQESYHVKQISIALGSGGFFGVGFGSSRQKYQYLPEVASDSIFAIIGEEFGYFGTTTVILIFSLLLLQGISVAKSSSDLQGRLLASGVTAWIGIQFLVNIAAMARLIPLTGVPIPLISYGGSSMVFSLMGLGVLASVARDN